FPTGHVFLKSDTDEDMKAACSFCKHSSDHCCKTLSATRKCAQQKSSQAVYLALTVSLCLLTAVVASFMLWTMCQKRKAATAVAVEEPNTEKQNSDTTASVRWNDGRSLSATGCPHNSLETTTPPRTRSFVFDKAFSDSANGFSMSPVSKPASTTENKAQSKAGLFGRTAAAFICSLARPTKALRRPTPLTQQVAQMPRSCQATVNSRPGQGGDKNGQAIAVCAAAKASTSDESIGPMLSKRNQSLRGRPDRL
ncbi:hypothetical protein LPJ57_010817, partial [Coemansia sp. RSA 486]